MAGRRGGAHGIHSATRQKGTHNRRSGVGTYARKKKASQADRYDRPAIEKGHAK